MDILVLRALGIGDLLVTVPALRGLRRAFPTDRIVLAAPGWLTELVVLTGAVDLLLPTADVGDLRWYGEKPGLAVNLHGSGPESIADLRATEPKRLLSHRHPAYPDLVGPEWRTDVHEVTRWCDLLAWHGIPADPTELAIARPDIEVLPGAVVVHPGAKSATRRWPPERFAAVAAALARTGHRVVVTGGPDEGPLAETVARAAELPEDAVLAGRQDLGEFAALVAGAALVVSNDTGVGHLATAYGTLSVLLFGSESPAQWGPPPDRPQHVVLRAGAGADDVLAAAQRLLMRSITAEVDRFGR